MYKKTYVHPKIQIVNINPSDIICTSGDTQRLHIGNFEEDDIPMHDLDNNDEWVIWGE